MEHNENTQAWIDALRSGQYERGTGSLVRIYFSREKAGQDTFEEVGREFCCLGVGTCLIPGIGIRANSDDIVAELPEDEDYFTDEALVGGARSLAPARFVEWLGFPGAYLDSTAEYDFKPGWPSDTEWDLQTQGREGAHFIGTTRLQELTLASLNDEGLTFEQIADLIDYFGAVPC